MSLVDLPQEQLKVYAPPRVEPEDFDAFWAATLAESRAAASPPTFEPVAGPWRTIDVFDVSFSGFDGQRIRGWLVLPAGATGRLPTIVGYVGYGGGRSAPHEHLHFASAGYAHFVMDTRGQGSTWSPGATPDIDVGSEGGQHPGFLTRGIDRPETYYYRRLITDAALAIDALVTHPHIDPDRMVVSGRSQGGALALTTAGLVPAVKAALVDVPFLCHWRRATEVTDAEPYHELTRYLAVHRDRIERVTRTMSYVDGCNFAPRASAPALFSVALMDEICPPSTVYAAYNVYAGPKSMRVWEFNGHEGGEWAQVDEQFAFLAELGLVP